MEIEPMQQTIAKLPQRPARFLIVEDDSLMEPLWSFIIDKVSPQAVIRWVTTEEAAEKAIQFAEKHDEDFDVIISDVFLSGSRTGLDLWQRYGHRPSLFLMTSVIEPGKFLRLLDPLTPQPLYLQKPLSVPQCTETLKALLEMKRVL